MKTALVFLAALFFYVAGSQPADAQTRTVRHPAAAGQALTIDLPSGWTANPDPDNNLIVVSPTTSVAYSLSLVPDEEGYTLDQFAREALGVAEATGIVMSDEKGLLPPYIGNMYAAKMSVGGMSLDLKMIIVKTDTGKIASATLITGPQTSAEEKAVGEMILKTIRVVAK